MTETWFEDSVQGGEISIENFSAYRADRKGRNRVGSCLYVRADIPVAPLISFSNGMIEIVMVKVPIWDLIIGVIYRPPDSTSEKWSEAINLIENTIAECQKDGKFLNVIIEGDLNFPNVNWNALDDNNLCKSIR